MLVMLLGVSAGTWAQEYVKDVMLLGSGKSAGKKKQEYIDKGWKDTNYNLNKGCGSDATNIYLLYTTTPYKKDAINYFCISEEAKDSLITSRIYLPVRGLYDDNFIKGRCNLNNNAGGKNLYLYYSRSRNPNDLCVTKIWFDNAPSGAMNLNSSPCDLNSGAGGSYIYMHYKGDEPNSYNYEDREWDAVNKKVVTTTKTCTNFTRLTSNNNDNHTVLKDGWYVLDYDIDYKEYLDIDGDVKIILVNGKTMNAKNGIRIKEGKKLTIYGQSGGSGTIEANGSIGGKGDIYAGELVIYGGTFTVKAASNNNAAIGSGNGDNNKKAGFKAITIYGGTIDAWGAPSGAGIGAGQGCNDDYQGPITIYGGTSTHLGAYVQPPSAVVKKAATGLSTSMAATL
jgi:hypothetical protein